MTKTYTLKDGTKVVAKATNKRVTKRFHNAEHYTYTITIESGDYKFRTSFHDSVHNYLANIGPTEKMIDNALYCIILDADSYMQTNGFSDFCSDFGYEEDDTEKARRIYDACKKSYDGIYTMFTEEQVDELFEMVE